MNPTISRIVPGTLALISTSVVAAESPTQPVSCIIEDGESFRQPGPRADG
jgi:hypothetical protein